MPDVPLPLLAPPPAAEKYATAAADSRSADERTFLELRRKVQESELLSAATDRLLYKMKFNGRLTVVIHNGSVLKSSYEEGYFRRKNDLGGG